MATSKFQTIPKMKKMHNNEMPLPESVIALALSRLHVIFQKSNLCIDSQSMSKVHIGRHIKQQAEAAVVPSSSLVKLS